MDTRFGFHAGGYFWTIPALSLADIDAVHAQASKASPLGRPACDNRRDFRLRLVVEYFTSDDRNRLGVSTKQFREMVGPDELTDALNALLLSAGEPAVAA